ncbi:glutaredoxin, partial [Wilcoxina mikolae CBS 423.85]
ELAELTKAHTILIFSKTHCPYSATAKKILTEKYHTVPPPYIIELDQHARGPELQEALAVVTGRSTVPNVLVAGKSIGGGDEIVKLDKENALVDTIRRLAGPRINQI